MTTTNPWIVYVNKFRAKHPKMSYKQALKKASQTYKKKTKTTKTKTTKTMSQNDIKKIRELLDEFNFNDLKEYMSLNKTRMKQILGSKAFDELLADFPYEPSKLSINTAFDYRQNILRKLSL